MTLYYLFGKELCFLSFPYYDSHFDNFKALYHGPWESLTKTVRLLHCRALAVGYLLPL